MNAPIRLLAGALLIVVLAAVVAACSVGTGPTHTTPAREPFAIRTPAVAPQACMEALIGGVLTRNAQSGLGITTEDGQATAVEWPFRYGATVQGNRVSLIDETGKVVAREGDKITIGGGMGNLLWYACGPVTIVKAAS